MMIKQSLPHALKSAFTRTSAPNLTQLFITIALALILIYLQQFKMQIKMKNQKYLGRDFNF